MFTSYYFLPTDKLRDIFEEFGEVSEYNIMKDPVTKKSR